MNCSDHPDPWFSEAGTPWHIQEGLDLSYSTDVVTTLRAMGDRTMMRWRVWGVDADGAEGTRSDWCLAAFSESGRPTPRAG